MSKTPNLDRAVTKYTLPGSRPPREQATQLGVESLPWKELKRLESETTKKREEALAKLKSS